MIVLPAEQPGGIENPAQGEQITQAAQARTLLLRRQKLVDDKGEPANVDDAPDGENIARRDKINLEAVGYLGSGLVIQRQGNSQNIDDKRKDDAQQVRSLTQSVF